MKVKPILIYITNKTLIKNIIYYDENGSVNYIDNSYKTFVANTFDSLANDLCYEGTNPKSELEISIGSNIKEKYKNIIESTLNYQESMDSAITMYVSLVSIVCIIIIGITILLIYLILYIVISSIIMKRKQELGIFKALGYKNKELVVNLIGRFIPSIIIGTSMGVIINILVMNQIYNKIFRLVGAYKVSFEYPVIIYIGISLIIAVSTLTIAYIVAKKIKMISLYSLIKD